MSSEAKLKVLLINCKQIFGPGLEAETGGLAIMKQQFYHLRYPATLPNWAGHSCMHWWYAKPEVWGSSHLLREFLLLILKARYPSCYEYEHFKAWIENPLVSQTDSCQALVVDTKPD